MFEVDLAQTIQITPAHAKNLIERVCVGAGITQLVLELPPVSNLEKEVPLESLVTSWSSSLEGYRIARPNDSAVISLNILSREKEKMTWSRSLGKEHRERVYKNFYQSIQSGFYRWESLSLYPAGEKIVYSLATCARLLRETFLNEKQPRLIPRFAWPSRVECIRIMRDRVTKVPWRIENYLGQGTIELKGSGGRLSFEIRGERGELEHSFASENHDDVYWELFKAICNCEFYAKDSNFTAAWFYLSDPT